MLLIVGALTAFGLALSQAWGVHELRVADSRVELHGLRGALELNGRRGEVVRWLEARRNHLLCPVKTAFCGTLSASVLKLHRTAIGGNERGVQQNNSERGSHAV